VEERDGARDGGCIAVGALGIGFRDGRVVSNNLGI
jgi:hypothetical protein